MPPLPSIVIGDEEKYQMKDNINKVTVEKYDHVPQLVGKKRVLEQPEECSKWQCWDKIIPECIRDTGWLGETKRVTGFKRVRWDN